MKKKARKKRKVKKPWTAWGTFYRRGGKLCNVFQHRDSAKAFAGTGHILRVAKVRITEIAPNRKSPK